MTYAASGTARVTSPDRVSRQCLDARFISESWRVARIAAGFGAAQILALRNLSAFEMTEAELRLIANAAIIGESSSPVNG